MTTTLETTIHRYIGLSTDTKPTYTRFVAGSDPYDTPTGSTYYCYDTGEMWVTYDGETYVPKDQITSGRIAKITQTKKIPTSNVYNVGMAIAENETSGTAWSFTNVVPQNAGSGYIVSASIISQAVNIVPTTQLQLYSAAPTFNTYDHVLTTGLTYTDAANGIFLGKIEFPALANIAATTGVPTALVTPSTAGNLPLSFNCAAGSRTIYGVLVANTVFTPVANNSVIVSLTIEQY